VVHPGGPYWAKRDEGAWSIPKGEVEPGEDAQAAALRELAEELGSILELGPLLDLGSVRQRSGKVVQAWAAETDFDPSTLRSAELLLEWPPRSGRRRPFPEVDRAEWVDLDVARTKLLPAQAAFVDRLLERLAGT
jgi:predicted NUDIX family NTP pyrophosphohydrolase